MRDASNERKGKEQRSCLPTRVYCLYIVFLLSIVSTTCQQVVFILIILFGLTYEIYVPQKLDHFASIGVHIDTLRSSHFKLQLDDDDGHTKLLPLEFFIHHSYQYWPAYVIHLTTDFVHTFAISYGMFIMVCTLLFRFQHLRLKYLVPNMFTGFNSKIYWIYCIDMSKFEREEKRNEEKKR